MNWKDYMDEELGSTIIGEEGSVPAIIALARAIVNVNNKIVEANEENKKLEKRNKILSLENNLLAQKIYKWADRDFIYAIISKYGEKIGNYQMAWQKYKMELLYQYDIDINRRLNTNHENRETKTGREIVSVIYRDEFDRAVYVAVMVCRVNDVDISDILADHIGDIATWGAEYDI